MRAHTLPVSEVRKKAMRDQLMKFLEASIKYPEHRLAAAEHGKYLNDDFYNFVSAYYENV